MCWRFELGRFEMPIPDFQTFMRPLLELVSAEPKRIRDCIDRLGEHFSLSEQERVELIPSGRMTRLASRVHWAATYMAQAGLVERPRRGVVVATERGREVLRGHQGRIDIPLLESFAEFQAFRERGRRNGDGPAAVEVAVAALDPIPKSPNERLEEAASEIESAIRSALLRRILAADPGVFEGLVVKLLEAMGYGGGRAGAGVRVGQSGDGGIDGVVNEDPLGLDVVHVQAKRYAPDRPIGASALREFAGALDERGALKGVFVTTSGFTRDAWTYSGRSPKRLILIDGERLTELLVRYEVAVRRVQRIDLFEVDDAAFDEPGS